jgi:hypothetical protein
MEVEEDTKTYFRLPEVTEYGEETATIRLIDNDYNTNTECLLFSWNDRNFEHVMRMIREIVENNFVVSHQEFVNGMMIEYVPVYRIPS